MRLAPFKANAAGRPLNTAGGINPPAVLSGNKRLLDRSGRFDWRASFSHSHSCSVIMSFRPQNQLTGNLFYYMKLRLLGRSGRFDRRTLYSHKEPTSATAIKALPHIEIYRIFMAMAVIVLESQRGKRKLVENGYSYVFDRRSTDGEKLFWRCDQK